MCIRDRATFIPNNVRVSAISNKASIDIPTNGAFIVWAFEISKPDVFHLFATRRSVMEHPFLRNEMLWGPEAQARLARAHVLRCV